MTQKLTTTAATTLGLHKHDLQAHSAHHRAPTYMHRSSEHTTNLYLHDTTSLSARQPAARRLPQLRDCPAARFRSD